MREVNLLININYIIIVLISCSGVRYGVLCLLCNLNKQGGNFIQTSIICCVCAHTHTHTHSLSLSQRAIHWMVGHWQYSLYISVIYVICVFAGKWLMKDRTPFDLRRPLVLWNIGLASFSIFGMFGVVPNLIR